ncbi:MAG: DNA polymerase III subunit chi [Candidatus Puniceispirillaceae bacterium]
MTNRPNHIDFYQFAGDAVSELVAQLSEKSVEVGKKIIIHAPEEGAQAISRALWVLHDASFLAHGIDDEDGAEFASVWITTKPDQNQIDADFALCVSGCSLPDMGAFERVFIVFNGKDEDALQTARSQWKAYSAAHEGKCRYFAKSDEGSWVQKA